MKSAVKGGAATNAPALSQIPLPRRKSSGKGEKILELNDTDSELGGRSPAKMSLLGASSFCCTSGQKEDYLPEARFLPTPKKKPSPVKQEPGSPLVPPVKPLLRSRRKMVESNSEDTLSQISELGTRKLSNEDIKLRSSADSRLRPPDQRGKSTPSSPHRKLSRDPLPFQKEILEAKKAGDLGKKNVRKDLNTRITGKKCKGDSAGDKCHEKGLDFASKLSKVSSSKICDESSTLFHPLIDSLDSSKSNSLSNSFAMSKVTSPVKIIPSERVCNRTADFQCTQNQNNEKTVSDDACHLPGMIAFRNDHECFDNHVSELDTVKCSVLSHECHQDIVDCVMVDKNEVIQDSHNSDDFDCPCCDKTPTAVDGPAIDSDLNGFTSWDVTPWTSVTTKSSFEDNNQKELALKAEVEALREDLEEKRLRLKTQDEQVQRLKEELIVMEQLEKELEKEKELRKIAEDKLLEVLDHQKRIESQREEHNEKCTESRATQKDDMDLTNSPESSPLIMGYESRVRRYQTYISKLEKDNQMLINELKKFKDMSPLGQEAQAQLLLEKLSEIHRSSQRQQLQYECCLDEVANRLVHTLLVQKRLEEECKILHLRVEQLEQENGTLMELMDDDKSENVTKARPAVDVPTYTKEQIEDPSHNASSSEKKTCKPSISFEEKFDIPPRSTNVKISEPKSPVSPTAKSSTKIPAFSNTKAAMVRKKVKPQDQPPKIKNEIHSTSLTSPLNIKSLSSLQTNRPTSPTNIKLSSSKNKTSVSFENSKGTSVKRRRLSRNGSPAEKGTKDSKQRMKNSHMRRQTVPENLSSLCESSKGDISPIQAFDRQQQIWSFNCEVNNDILLPESSRKIDESIDVFQAKLNDSNKEHLEELNKQNFSAEASTSIGSANRTRDEGYSTMSSDLQPDSAADTNVSEQEVSVTYTMTEKELRCVSDDSITECLDGSMCSSSDSGFGPLHLIANSKSSASKPSNSERCSMKESLKTAQEFFRNISTVRHRDQIASVKPTIRSNNLSSNNEGDKSSTFCDINPISKLKTCTEEFRLSPLIAKNILQKLDGSFQTSSVQKSKFDYISMLDYWNCDNVDIASKGKTWHLGSKMFDIENKHSFCSKQSFIEDCFFDEKVKTAEKATLTEPEEEMWREMTLAPFIDESIWSLYSSEGDIRMKHFPLEPLLSEPSLDKLISECNPCIIITEETDLPSDLHSLPKFVETNIVSDSTGADLVNGFKSGLERVASDTVLYLKDAIHELEDSMHRGLKSSKNVSSLHTSESEASPSTFKPELLLSLDRSMAGQSHLIWPSPTRSSSNSSVQSSASCHVISDETDDDLLRTSSRKGSQDLSSASDGECENKEHKDFVERWLQNEITQSPISRITSSVVPQPESFKRKSSLPYKPSIAISRPRFMSYPQTTASSLSNLRQRTTGKLTPSTTVPRKFASFCSTDDVESQGMDPEAKEFNSDFYKLCCVDSLRSLDLFSPAKSADAQNKLSTESSGSDQNNSFLLAKWEKPSKISIESPNLNKKKLGLASSLSKSKPTGLVKPTRPVTLVVGSDNSNVPDHTQSKILYFQNSTHVCTSEQISSMHVCTSTEHNAKTVQVPQHNYHPVLQNKSSLTSLPVPEEEKKRSGRTGTEVRTPRKILVKCSPGHCKRQHGGVRQRLSKEGCGTAWIHLEANPELNDPMNRISLLDSLRAPSSSSSDEEEDVLVIQTNSHLHRICQERRHKVKASAHNPLFDCKKRSSIMGRRELFYRFGDKEREAIACFDFLEELPTSSGETLSLPTMSPPLEHFSVHRTSTPPSGLCLVDQEMPSKKERIAFLSPIMSSKSSTPLSSHKRVKLPDLWNQPLSQRMSSNLQTRNCELLDHISLSDSCAESYSSTPDSCYEEAS